MKPIWINVIASFLALNLFAAASSSPKEIRIGFIPPGPKEDFEAKALTFAELVQKELQIPVKILIPKTYDALIDAMKEKRVDYAFFTALTYVKAEQSAKAKVLMRKVWEERDYYFSSIIVNNDSPIKSLTDLKGKRIAFVDKSSTSGYLYPMAALKSVSLSDDKDFKEVKFSRNHKASVEMLEDKKVDAAAVFAVDKEGKGGAWTHLFDPDKKMKSIWVSKHIPSDPFCVHQDFYQKYPELTHSLMFFLKSLTSGEPGKHKLKELLDIDRMELATSKQYDSVREMLKVLGPVAE